MLDVQIGFIGAGQMARALARGFVQRDRIVASQIVAYDPEPAALGAFAAELPACRCVANNRAVVEQTDVIFLAVKPQSFSSVCHSVAGQDWSGKLVVSILAGIPLANLATGLGTERLARVMPNTPCLIGQGASGYALGAGAQPADGRLVDDLLQAVGMAFPLPEKLLDAVTGLSGSGPAYVYTLIEALSDGGVRAGLPRATATALAAQTVLGSAQMVLSTGEHPAVLKDRVTSPGGTTIAGLQVLERRGFRSALLDAVETATARSRELGQSG